MAFTGELMPVFSISGFWIIGSFVRTGFEEESVFTDGAGTVVGWFIGRLSVVLTIRALSWAAAVVVKPTVKNTKHSASPTILPKFIKAYFSCEDM